MLPETGVLPKETTAELLFVKTIPASPVKTFPLLSTTFTETNGLFKLCVQVTLVCAVKGKVKGSRVLFIELLVVIITPPLNYLESLSLPKLY